MGKTLEENIESEKDKQRSQYGKLLMRLAQGEQTEELLEKLDHVPHFVLNDSLDLLEVIFDSYREGRPIPLHSIRGTKDLVALGCLEYKQFIACEERPHFYIFRRKVLVPTEETIRLEGQ